MPRATVISKESIEGTDRYIVKGLIQYGKRETLNPVDVKVNVIHWIHLAPRALNPLNASGSPSGQYLGFNTAFPIGSVYYRGVVGSQSGPPNIGQLQGAFGSTVLLLWLTGSSGTRYGQTLKAGALGTVAAGTRSAYFEIIGS